MLGDKSWFGFPLTTPIRFGTVEASVGYQRREKEHMTQHAMIQSEAIERTATPKPVDGKLNRSTRTLFEALHAATGRFTMFGHQNETSNVISDHADSDVHAVTGSYPAVWGNDLGGVELDSPNTIDGFGADLVRREMFNDFTHSGFMRMADTLPPMYR